VKLSEAIRAGAQLRPPAIGQFFEANADGVLCSCALAAAYEVVIGAAHPRLGAQHILPALERVFPCANAVVNHPVHQLPGSVYGAVMNLNDEYHWSREQIADWLASIGY